MHNDQYDLSITDFKKYLKGFLKFGVSTTNFFWLVLQKKKFILLSTLLISAVISFYLLQRNKSIVEARMSCVFSDNYQKVFGEMLQQVNFLLENEDYNEAGQLLNIDANEVKKIVEIKGKTISLGKMEEVYSTHKDPFYIYVRVTDPSILPLLEEKVLEYLNQNPLSQKSVQRQKEKWQGRISFYEQQLVKLDSLKDVIRQSYVLQNNQIDLAQQNNSVVDIYKLSDSLSFFLGDIKYYYNNYASVEKIYGFMPVKKSSEKSNLKKSITISIIAFLVIWIFFAFAELLRRTEN